MSTSSHRRPGVLSQTVIIKQVDIVVNPPSANRYTVSSIPPSVTRPAFPPDRELNKKKGSTL
jgi:hypothetical protein